MHDRGWSGCKTGHEWKMCQQTHKVWREGLDTHGLTSNPTVPQSRGVARFLYREHRSVKECVWSTRTARKCLMVKHFKCLQWNTEPRGGGPSSPGGPVAKLEQRSKPPPGPRQRIVSPAERFLGARWIYFGFFKQIFASDLYSLFSPATMESGPSILISITD